MKLMNDKSRKYGSVVSVPHELLDRFSTYIPRIEEELAHKLADQLIKEAIKGECIVRFTETRQREDFTTGLIEFHKSVCVEEIVRCKDCRYYEENERWCFRLGLVGAFDKGNFCSHGERRTDE